MGRTRSRRRSTQKGARYRAFHAGLDVFGLTMLIGTVILMFGFVVLQILEHVLRK